MDVYVRKIKTEENNMSDKEEYILNGITHSINEMLDYMHILITEKPNKFLRKEFKKIKNFEAKFLFNNIQCPCQYLAEFKNDEIGLLCKSCEYVTSDDIRFWGGNGGGCSSKSAKAYFKMRNFDYIPQLNISETDCMCYLNLISDVFNGIMHSINERTSTRKILEKLITDIYNDGAMRSIGFVRKLIFLYINKYEGVKKKGVKKEK